MGNKKSLAEQKHDLIIQHILDPDNSPLPDRLKVQFDRIRSAARMLDSYHPSNVIPRLQAKYNISRNTAREDVKFAQELFKTKHTFDWDFWQAWQIKDIVETIRICRLQNRHKERIAAHKVLREIIGAKPMGEEDPRRMEKNVFYIQLNNNNTTVNVPLDKLRGLSNDDVQIVMSALTAPDNTDEEIVEILNT